MISVHFQGKPFNITVIQVYAPTTNAEEAEGLPPKPTRFSRNNNSKKRCPSHHRGLDTKVQSQEISKVTGKFGLGVHNEVGQRLTEFCQENALVITHSSNLTTEDSTRGHHQMVNTEIRLIIFFATKDREALHSQQSKTGS